MKSLLSQDQIGESTFSASILTQNPVRNAALDAAHGSAFAYQVFNLAQGYPQNKNRHRPRSPILESGAS
jgi:hypothetical protein